MKETLHSSMFELKEKQNYWKKKWLREHISTILICAAIWLALTVIMKTLGANGFLIGAVSGVLLVLCYAMLNNRMMAYVEKHVFGGEWNEHESSLEDKLSEN